MTISVWNHDRGRANATAVPMHSKNDHEGRSAVSVWQVGDWRVETALNELRRGGAVQRIEPKVMEVLVCLALHAGQVVSRETLLGAVWPDVIVGDDVLSQAMVKLRKALRDDTKPARHIETIPKRGYRLVAPVRPLPTYVEPGAKAGSNQERVSTPVARDDHRRVAAVIGRALLAAAVVFAVLLLAARDQQDSAVMEGRSTLDNVSTSETLPVLAVTRFETQAGDIEQANVARGIEADLTTELSRTSELRVADLTRPQSDAVRSAMRDAYVLAGSIRGAGAGLTINARLIHATTGELVWAGRYEARLDASGAVEPQIVGRLSHALATKIDEAEMTRVAHRYTPNLEAFSYYVRARTAYRTLTREGNDASKVFYRKALELDPAFARAYEGLALSYVADYRNGWTDQPESAISKAFDFAHTGLQLGQSAPSNYAGGYVALGYVHLARGEHRKALRHLNRAIALDPTYADAYTGLATVYTYMGEPYRAVPLVRSAMRLRGGNGFEFYFLALGRAYFFQENAEQAQINLREALNRNPADLEAHLYMAANLAASGNIDAAQWEVDEVRHLRPGFACDEWFKNYPITDDRMKQRLISLLRLAGLP